MDRVMVGVAAAVLAVGFASGARAQDAVSTLSIEGTSTVRSWTCEARSFEVLPKPVRGFEEAVLRGEPALETVTLTFPVMAIDCGNGTMNDHMRKALEAEDHPQIRYSLSKYDIAGAGSGVEVRADGELMIAGRTRPVSMAVKVTRDDTGGVRVRGEQEVRMTDFGVRPPKLMLGTLKVGDVVLVKFDVPLQARHLGVAAASANGSDNE